MRFPKEWSCDNEEHIWEMIGYWKPLLGISDWGIELGVKPAIDVCNRGVAASRWILSRRIGWVDLSRTDSRKDDAMPDDTEMSVVHELLHIAFAAWHEFTEETIRANSFSDNVCCEQPIDQLAETLVLMRRGSGHKFSFEQQPSRSISDMVAAKSFRKDFDV
jgi:hypothetical protein